MLEGVVSPELDGTDRASYDGTVVTGKDHGIGETTNTGGNADSHYSDGSKGSYGYEGAGRGKV